MEHMVLMAGKGEHRIVINIFDEANRALDTRRRICQLKQLLPLGCLQIFEDILDGVDLYFFVSSLAAIGAE